MPDKARITSEDMRLMQEDWEKEQKQHLAEIQREPVNADPYSQAHLLNQFFKKLGD